MSNFGEKELIFMEATEIVVINESKIYKLSKRTIDIIGASLGIILLLMLFIIIGVLIKLDDPKGAILFKQKRVGKNQKEFNMYKFRSMVTDAEFKLADLIQKNEVSGAMFKMKEDPRVTKIGKFIRKTSIDELPQLINVLRGEMSLVGPRPPLPREVKEYSKHDMQRLLVTPGCTGLWQVSGRSNIGFKEMVRLDIKYIKNRSLSLDLKIIMKTIWVLLKTEGSY